MRLGYSFARVEAAESFRAAQQLDPDCAMCYWGEAWVLGPYQNNPAAAEERYADAENYLREAIKLEDRLPYSEPEPWPIPSRHVLGAVLLEADQPEKAEQVYHEALDIHHNNGWSLKGVKQSLEAQGKTAKARQVLIVTSSEYSLSGKMRVNYQGQAPGVLDQFTYAYGPPKLPHDTVCRDQNEDCILFIVFEEPVDAIDVRGGNLPH